MVEAEQRVERVIGETNEEIPVIKSVVEIVSDDIEVEPLAKAEAISADTIAENVAKEMKKTAKTVTKTTSSKSTTAKTTKKSTTAKTTKRVTKKTTATE